MLRRGTENMNTHRLYYSAEPIPNVTDERLRRLYDYWQTHREGGLLPARSDIDPIKLRRLCHHLALFDVQHNPLRIDLRLQIAGFESWVDDDLTGEWPNARSSSPVGTSPHACLANAAESGTPRHWIGETRDATTPRAAEALFLPFANDGITVNAVLVALRRPEANTPS